MLHRVRQPFNVNTLAQVAATAALNDAEFLKKTRDLVHDELQFIYAALDKLKLPYIRSQANFLMIEIGDGQTADEIAEKLLMQGVIVRALTAYGYPQHIRVTVGQHAENVRFIEALKTVI
jgi:histidinol-phosphate aminotransferase